MGDSSGTKTALGIGISNDAKAYDAGRNAAREAVKSLGKSKPTFALIFSSVKYDLQKMLDGTTSVLKDTPSIGCSSFGHMIGKGVANDSVVVIAFHSDSAKISMGLGKKLSKSSYNAAKQAMEQAIEGMNVTDVGNFLITKSHDDYVMYSPYNAIVCADGLTGNGDEIARAIKAVAGERFPIIGGTAADDFEFKKTYQFFNGKVYTDSVAIALINLNLKTGIGVSHGWKPIGKALVVTKSKGSLVQKIDGEPALKVYQDCFGVEMAKLLMQPLAKFAITYPLGIASTEKEYRIRTPFVAKMDGAIAFNADIPEDSVVRIMDGEPKTAIDAAETAAKQAWINAGRPKKADIVGAIMFNDTARYKCIGEKTPKEIAAVEKVLGKVPIYGVYTYGGFAPTSDFTAQFHSETLIIYLITRQSTSKVAGVMRAVNYMYNI